MPTLGFGLLLFSAAFVLSFSAHLLVRSTLAEARRAAAEMSGFAAARHVLDSAGLHSVAIEQTPGRLSDHYDPRDKVLRLSGDVYHGRSLAAVGVAAHEAGHAIQDKQRYAPLIIRGVAAAAAAFGSIGGLALCGPGAILALLYGFPLLLLAGIAVFSCAVFFQLVNLPVEFNASARAKDRLVRLEIVGPDELPMLQKALNAAALTYLAASLQSILTLVRLLRPAGDQA